MKYTLQRRARVELRLPVTSDQSAPGQQHGHLVTSTVQYLHCVADSVLGRMLSVGFMEGHFVNSENGVIILPGSV